ncbi:MAG TPA: protein translocase subunit SecF [Candidatus Paceibacterota bacterium]|nr:protein translocase subunit SecF [Candidatus Paceibacterota bacterium]
MKRGYTIMFIVSVTVLVISVAALVMYGLNFGVDFTGGSVLEVEYAADRPSADWLATILSDSEDPIVRNSTFTLVGDQGVIFRSSDRTEGAQEGIMGVLTAASPDAQITQRHFDFIGPVIGQELKSKSLKAIVILLVAVLVYIAWMFRTLKRSLSLWAMAAGTVVGLAHDIVIPLGLFAVLGHFKGVEISAVFVAAVLTILGYTVSDKVVIYDRVRENILRGSREPLPDVVHKSVMQTLVRSINNTLVVMLSSLAVFLFGGESIRYFALALMVGIGLGAYSSIFVASPLLVWLSKRGR